jgi:hypothetical protein
MSLVCKIQISSGELYLQFYLNLLDKVKLSAQIKANVKLLKNKSLYLNLCSIWEFNCEKKSVFFMKFYNSANTSLSV